jgi:hypothetical protein
VLLGNAHIIDALWEAFLKAVQPCKPASAVHSICHECCLVGWSRYGEMANPSSVHYTITSSVRLANRPEQSRQSTCNLSLQQS